MATYYVDYGASNDTGAGTELDPWKYCPGDARSGNSLSADDTVYFKRGVTYTLDASGPLIASEATGVTYTVTDWGAGDATIDANSRTSCFDIDHDDCIISGGSGKNLVLTDGGAGADQPAVHLNEAGLDGVTIEYVRFSTYGDSGSSQGYGIKIGGDIATYENIEVSNCDFDTIYDYAIKLSGWSHDCSIHDCDFDNCGKTNSTVINISQADNNADGVYDNYVYNNTIHDGREASTDGIALLNTGNYIYDNTFYNLARGISISYTNYDYYMSKPSEIYRNTIYDCSEAGISINYTGDDATASYPDADAYNKIYSNLLYNNGNYNINVNTYADGNLFYGNTIYDSGTEGGIYLSPSCDSNIVKNNAIHVVGSGSDFTLYFANANNTEDYNQLYKTQSAYTISWNGTPYDNITTYRSASSQGANSAWGDPLFVSPTTDFSLQEGSPARDKGVTLGSPYNVDYLGVSRPQGVAYDIGAYEYYAGGGPDPDPVPPAEGPFAANLMGIL